MRLPFSGQGSLAIAYLNGEWMPPEEATIPISDRGFLFGDGIYENMAVYDRKVFKLEAHLDRLECSLSGVRLQSPLDRNGWIQLIEEAVVRGNENPAFLYLQVTRGSDVHRSHIYPSEITPTVLVTVTPGPILTRETIRPYKMKTSEDFRWSRGDIKVTSLVANGLLRNEALSQGYDDAILIRDGKVTEATAANVFIVKNGSIATPPKSRFLLSGVTRDHVIEICRAASLEIEEREISLEELESADEVWISSTGHEVWPVVQINNTVIGNGGAGAMWQTADQLFQASKQ